MKKQPASIDSNKPSDPKLAPIERIERDADDLVHEKQIEPEITGEEDPDDMIHRQPKTGTATEINEDSMEDPDDLVHGFPDKEEE
jgi:hypothetical protein